VSRRNSIIRKRKKDTKTPALQVEEVLLAFLQARCRSEPRPSGRFFENDAFDHEVPLAATGEYIFERIALCALLVFPALYITDWLLKSRSQSILITFIATEIGNELRARRSA
jgi:hypothetical protein